MNKNLKENERALVKQVNYFKKKALRMLEEGKLSDGHKDLVASCEKLAASLEAHADRRAMVLEQRNQLKNIIRENAVCPKCGRQETLKLIGPDKSPEGWRCNKYRCKKCNIEFVQDRPNNPWDMIPYIAKQVDVMEQKIAGAAGDDPDFIAQSQATILQMKETVEKLRPVIEASDQDYQELKERDAEMEKLTSEFKTLLLIERIKLDAIK